MKPASRGARRGLGVLAAALVVATAGPADAYVRYAIKNSTLNFAWFQSCVEVSSFPSDMLSVMPMEEIDGATMGAASAWSGNDCTYLAINLTDSVEPTPHAAQDYKNNLIFRVNNWCKLNPDGTCDASMPLAYDQQALALTSVIASTKTGEIRDVDIEVNVVNFQWADLVLHPELAQDGIHQDLQNALTHEMGHMIGLDHTCYSPSSNLPRPIDNNGDPLIYCSGASADVKATTMYPSAEPGDLEKRTLAPDDLQALCDIYPVDRDPMKCEPITPSNGGSGCGCATAGSGPDGAAAAGLLMLGGLVLGLRRRRRSRA
jgi:MYXO-CTERM domain-containing protein